MDLKLNKSDLLMTIIVAGHKILIGSRIFMAFSNNNTTNTDIYAAHHIHSGRVLKALTTDRATC